MEWCEFQLCYADPKKIDMEKLYDLRKQLFRILDRHGIEDFLVLDEPECVIFRVKIIQETKKDIENDLQEIIRKSGNTFSNVRVESWNPLQDATKRILGAAQRLGLKLEEKKGWMIVGREPTNRLWIPAPDDLDLKTREFAIFMTKVVGKFTRAYIEQMPRKIRDRWLLSVLLHLLLNSISVDQSQEDETREFPYV